MRCDRAEGTATLHASTLLHAVTRVQVRRTCHTRLCEEALFTEKHNPRPATQALFTPRSCHAVARVQGPAARYSLILFYRQICPAAAHRLVECSVATMDLLYPPEEGSYSCDACGDSRLHRVRRSEPGGAASRTARCEHRRELEEQGCRSMWHCAAGCEYDLCGVCHDVGLADGVEYVSVR